MNQGKTASQRLAEESRLSKTMLDTLTSEVDIERKTYNTNGAGGQVETWAIPSNAHRCVKAAINDHKSIGEVIVSDKPTALNQFVIHLPPGTDVRPEDRILDRASGKRFQVDTVKSPVSVEVIRTVFATWIK